MLWRCLLLVWKKILSGLVVLVFVRMVLHEAGGGVVSDVVVRVGRERIEKSDRRRERVPELL